MRAVIFGCEGPSLGDWERQFFRAVEPTGFILFLRNLEEPNQIRRLVAELKACVGRDPLPILIDQEGGRVQRLKPPYWRAAPAAARFGALASRDRELARHAAAINGRLLAVELRQLGITVDCVPLLDLRFPGAHEVIGDRAFSHDPEIVATLGRAQAEGLVAGGVLPVIKHLPGHGRALADSHLALPEVAASRAELEASDFRPFKALADLPLGMTGHVLYTALDAERCSTLSPVVVREVIRNWIGFDGLLMTDDLSMSALGGSYRTRAEASLAAGCDLVLHCNGKRAEMEAVAEGTPELPPEREARLTAALATIVAPEPAEQVPLARQLDGLLGTA